MKQPVPSCRYAPCNTIATLFQTQHLPHFACAEQVVSVATPELGMHALLKLTNAAGDCLGQAVIPLADILNSDQPKYVEVIT